MSVKIRLWGKKWTVVIHYQGERVSVQPGKNTQEAAQELADKLIKRLEVLGPEAFAQLKERKTRKDAKTPTVKAYGEKWISRLAGTALKASTVQSYRSNLQNHIFPDFGKRRLDQVKREDLLDWVDARAKEVKEDGTAKYSRNSIRLMLQPFRLMMNEAVDSGLIVSHPVRRLGRYYGAARPKRKPDPFTREELEAILGTFAGKFPEYYEMVLGMARAGVRIGEVVALEWEDFEELPPLEKGQDPFGRIHVRRNMPSCFYRSSVETSPKTLSSERVVDASPQLVKALKLLRGRQKAEVLAGKRKKSPYIFADPKGRLVDYSVFNRSWGRAIAATKLNDAPIRYRSPHQVRHSWASILLSEGAPLGYVSTQLGHKNQQITLEIYAHWIPKKTEVPEVAKLDSKTDQVKAKVKANAENS